MKYACFCVTIFLSVLLFSSCSNTRFLKEGEVLYTGVGKVTVTDKENLKKNKEAAALIDEITAVKPNNALFGTRRELLPIGLWSHNYFKPKKEGKKEGKRQITKQHAKQEETTTFSEASLIIVCMCLDWVDDEQE